MSFAWLDGILLSDGHLRKQARNASLQVELKLESKPVLDELASLLIAADFAGTRVRESGQRAVLTTYVDPRLTYEHTRWYTPTKHVPADLVLTPETIRWWYIGDGTTNKRGHMSFCTDSFSADDVARLQALLAAEPLFIESIQSTPPSREGAPRIEVYRVASARRLAGIIEPMPLTMEYKTDRVLGV